VPHTAGRVSRSGGSGMAAMSKGAWLNGSAPGSSSRRGRRLGRATEGGMTAGHLPLPCLVGIRHPVVVADDRRGQGVLDFGITRRRRDIADADSRDPN
jgi:hypothetical protein